MSKQALFFLGIAVFVSCGNEKDPADAYGNFESVEVIVAAQTQGRILAFGPNEGEELRKGEVAVTVDSTQLQLKKEQLESGRSALKAKIGTLKAQIGVSLVNLRNLKREQKRIVRLFEGGAATPRQVDDITGQVELVEARIEASESQKASIYAEAKALEAQIEQVNDQIDNCTVTSPIDGVVLTRYREPGEIAAPGQPLFKIAKMNELVLRAYISGNQLSSVGTGKQVTVRFDRKDEMGKIKGVITWISPTAEFTPKIIQTREERVTLVYAIKVVVPNDGSLKIGMPGEVFFN